MVRRLIFNWLPLALTSMALQGETTPAFTKKPAAVKEGDRVKIEFAVDRETDVAVYVEDAQGKVIRHLVSGRLGKNPPARLKPGSLAQSLEWGDPACYCFSSRLAIDPYGRVLAPNVFPFSVEMLDANGNQIDRIGRYGNADDCDGVRFAWPAFSSWADGNLYVSDSVNRRVVVVRFEHAAAVECTVAAVAAAQPAPKAERTK
ncbi:MAG: hypothetical protein AMS14_11675 [Planctomycetes bacterium DG_20]|nr:MAG: hypothetical protein AMS14_11675 [Planctomycetes bacterium DG_20]